MQLHRGRLCPLDKQISGTKLMVTWIGPFRVKEARPHSFKIENLITGCVIEVHGSRLRFYADHKLNVSEELIEHIGKQGIMLGVAAIKDHRYNTTIQKWQLLVAWQGFQDIDDSWELLDDLYRVRDYIQKS